MTEICAELKDAVHEQGTTTLMDLDRWVDLHVDGFGVEDLSADDFNIFFPKNSILVQISQICQKYFNWLVNVTLGVVPKGMVCLSKWGNQTIVCCEENNGVIHYAITTK